MTKPRLFLHIGEPKTGTTAIQTFLLANRAALRRKGFLYPLAGVHDSAHRKLSPAFYAASLTNNDAAETLEAVLREVREAGCATTILSFEGFCLDNPRSLAGLAREFDVKVVYYLRRQDHLFESRYAQHVRSCLIRQVRPPGLVLRDFPHYADYLRVLKLYAALFGRENMIVRLFEPQSLFQNDPVLDFLQVIGLPMSPEYVPSTSSNAALKRPYLAFLRQCNALPLLEGEHLKLELELTVLSQNDKTPTVRHLVSPADRRSVLDRHAAMNAEIARDWFGKPGGTLFEEPLPADSQPWAPLEQLDPGAQHSLFDQLSAGMQDLLEFLSRDIRQRLPGEAFLPVLPGEAEAIRRLLATRDQAALQRRMAALEHRLAAAFKAPPPPPGFWLRLRRFAGKLLRKTGLLRDSR